MISISDVFAKSPENTEPGSRLGIPFLRAQEDEVEVKIGDRVIRLSQSSLGLAAISSCVWDCGLAMVDYLQACHYPPHGEPLGHTMDIGCGTGVAGIAAAMLNAESVTFTDTTSAEALLLTNLAMLRSNHVSTPTEFVEFDWVSGDMTEFQQKMDRGGRFWDTLLLSDVLYEQKSHAALMRLLRGLSFRKAIFAYKRRHDEPEKLFLLELESWCSLVLVSSESISTIVNVTRAQFASGLYILVATPKGS
jgi:predicted nicotinamide N-methyase